MLLDQCFQLAGIYVVFGEGLGVDELEVMLFDQLQKGDLIGYIVVFGSQNGVFCLKRDSRQGCIVCLCSVVGLGDLVWFGIQQLGNGFVKVDILFLDKGGSFIFIDFRFQLKVLLCCFQDWLWYEVGVSVVEVDMVLYVGGICLKLVNIEYSFQMILVKKRVRKSSRLRISLVLVSQLLWVLFSQEEWLFMQMRMVVRKGMKKVFVMVYRMLIQVGLFY